MTGPALASRPVRHVAFLRGVSPLNARMPEVQRCFEAAGFGDVRTLLSSGNVAFDTPLADLHAIARTAEAAMASGLGRSFDTIVRTAAHLQAIVETDPFAAFDLPAGGKCVVTFLRDDPVRDLTLPVSADDATVLHREGREVYSVYVPNAKGAAFMALIERTWGKALTTRTLGTVRTCAWA